MRALLTVKECADYLNMSTRSIYRMIYGHRIPVYRIPGGGYRLKPETLDQWINENARGAEGWS